MNAKAPISPIVRFAGYTDSYVLRKIRDVISNTGGTSLESQVLDTGTHKFISIGNYSRDGRFKDNGQRVSLNEKTKSKLLRKDDLVMVLNDKTKTGDIIGATILIEEDNSYIYNQRSERLSPDHAVLSSLYCWFLFNSPQRRREVFGISQGGTQIYVNFSAVKQQKIALPSLPEQQKIANFLTAVDGQIQQLIKMEALLEDYKKGVMQQLFTQAIRFKDDHSNDFPDWGEKTLGGACSFLKDGTHGTHPDDDTSDFLLLSAKNIRDGKVNFDQTDRRISEKEYLSIYKNYALERGDILLSVVGSIGRVAIYSDEKNVAFQRSVAFLRFDKDSPNFMYHQFCHELFQRQLLRRQVTSAQPGIYLGDIAKISVITPCVEEQIKIAAFLTSIDRKIESVGAQITQTQTFKKGLLQQMFV